jgi:CheY-like chemotaxis protein
MNDSTKILIVDDEKVGRQLLEAILIPEGYLVLFGENGEEAVAVAKSQIPDIILCDVMMPKLDGFEVCKQIRADKATAHIPVFLITALDDRDSRIRGIDAGADDYISKPFDRIEILAKIKNHYNLIQHRLRGGNELTIPGTDLSGINVSPGLVETLAELVNTIPQLKDGEVFRAGVAADSQHLYACLDSGALKYHLLLSNHLNKVNSLLANTILLKYMERYILQGIISPNLLIQNVIEDLKSHPSIQVVNDFKDADFAIAVLASNNNDGTKFAAGINQTIFADPSVPASNTKNSNEFQSFYLMGNQDIPLQDAGQAVIFSPNAFKTMELRSIHNIVNQTFNRHQNNQVESIFSPIFDPTNDILIVKLTFQGTV